METINPSDEALMLFILSFEGSFKAAICEEVRASLLQHGLQQVCFRRGLQSLPLYSKKPDPVRNRVCSHAKQIQEAKSKITAWEVRNERIKQQINVSSNIGFKSYKVFNPALVSSACHLQHSLPVRGSRGQG